MSNNNTLIDSFGRRHNYLRLSLTDNCNFRCTYCMPEGKHQHSDSKMSPDEIAGIVNILKKAGIDKLRLTGGEPLAREDFGEIITKLKPVRLKKAITTNGLLLDRYFDILAECGFKRLNISLDSLRKRRFEEITGSKGYDRVFANIIQASGLGFHVKVNTVLMRGYNDTEIADFAELTLKHKLSVRFIEFMPFAGNNWKLNTTVSTEEILAVLNKKFVLVKLPQTKSSTAIEYKIQNAFGNIGIISNISHSFCKNCNRLRITADGKLKSCLFGNNETDILSAYENNIDLTGLVNDMLKSKPYRHGCVSPLINRPENLRSTRSMTAIGG